MNLIDARPLNLIDASQVKPYNFMGVCDSWKDSDRVH